MLCRAAGNPNRGPLQDIKLISAQTELLQLILLPLTGALDSLRIIVGGYVHNEGWVKPEHDQMWIKTWAEYVSLCLLIIRNRFTTTEMCTE